jgi:polyhydroxybutyrate depolymerase
MRRLSLPLFLCAAAGCSSVDLYPVTRDAETFGGSSGAGGSTGGSATGGSATGGSATGGSTTGDSAAGGSAGAGASAGAGGGNGGGGGSAGGCAKTLAPGDSVQTLSVAGRTRNYVLHVPPAYDGTERVPLVLDFHALGGTGKSELSSSPYPAVLDPEGVIQAFPDGLRGPAGTAWNVGPCCVEDVDDVAFARAIVAHAQSLACVDPTRVYAVGVLTGGGLAHYLGCHAADLFAAIAPAAFDLLEENVEDCSPQRPITSISFRGTGTSRVPYEGGPSSLVPGMPLTFLGALATAERWASINGCGSVPSEPDADGCITYPGCDAGAEVILCTKPGGREDPGDPRIAWPTLARHRLE